MRHLVRSAVAALAVIALAGVLSTVAQASCGKSDGYRSTSGTGPAGHLVPAVWREGLPGTGLLPVSDEENDDGPSIVGLWQFKWAGFVKDFGLVALHRDGTETTFSGGQNPETGDVCLGVWRKTGPNTYTLNHIAMGWFAPGAGFGLRFHLHFLLTLDASGNSFHGTYKVTAYQETPGDPFNENPALQVGSGTGTITATRVQPD